MLPLQVVELVASSEEEVINSLHAVNLYCRILQVPLQSSRRGHSPARLCTLTLMSRAGVVQGS